MKYNNSQQYAAAGYAHVIIVLLFAITAIIGTGYYVYSRIESTTSTDSIGTSKDSTSSSATKPSATVQEQSLTEDNLLAECSDSSVASNPCPSQATIPENWTTYTNTEFGFSLAYPSEFGSVERGTTPYNPEPKVALKTTTGAAFTYVEPMSYLYIGIYDKADFMTQATKYGATIKLHEPGSSQWVVVSNDEEINPMGVKYKAGDSYQAGSLGVIRRTINTYKIFHIGMLDDACSVVRRFAFETKNAMVLVQSPPYCATNERAAQVTGDFSDMRAAEAVEEKLPGTIEVF